MRTTKDNKPVVATEMVATTLKALPFTAVPKQTADWPRPTRMSRATV